MSLDPQVADFLKRQTAANVPPLCEMSLADARSLVVPTGGPRVPVERVEKLQIPSGGDALAARLYVPRAEFRLRAGRLPVIVYFHGGGWVLGDLNASDGLCRELVERSGSAVISIDYRLAPEHKYPTAVEDAYATTRWVADNAASLGVNAAEVVVMGDSAGGNLAACVCLMAKARGGPKIAQQLLIYPITDADFERASYLENAEGYYLTRASMIWFWRQYLETPKQAREPLAAPLQADDLSELPPAFVLTAEYDVLRDEGLAYAERLEAAGVEVERLHCPGMIHGFVRRTDLFDRAGEALTEIGGMLRERFGQTQ